MHNVQFISVGGSASSGIEAGTRTEEREKKIERDTLYEEEKREERRAHERSSAFVTRIKI